MLAKNFDVFGAKDGEDILTIALHNYGITDIEKFLSPTKDDCYDPFLMNNMSLAVILLHETLEQQKDKKILLKVDPDVDGFTSSALMYQFIKAISPEQDIQLVFDYEKVHGLKAVDVTDRANTSLIVVPDASFEEDEYDAISALGIPVLILDHHIIANEKIHNHALIVSCMDGKYPNQTLTGVGVVYKFCEAFCKFYEVPESIFNPTDFLDLVSLGLIADSADARELETRYYMLEGLSEKSAHNYLITALEDVKKAENSMRLGRTITNFGWFIAPMINGCVRYGKEDEQLLVFRALCNIQEDIWYQPRRKCALDPLPDRVLHTLADEGARACKNIKARQDRDTRSYLTELDLEIEAKKLDKNRVLFIDASGVLKKKTLTGLVANKLASKYMRPCVLLKSYDADYFGGSGRAYEFGEMDDFGAFLMGTGLFESCAGHANAFGVKLKKENLEKVIEVCNNTLPEEASQTIYPVDFQVSAKDLTPSAVALIANQYAIFGNGVPSPQFAITDIEIPAKKISSPIDQTIHFVYKKIHYVLKFPKLNTFDRLTLADRRILGTNTKMLHINLIGHFTIEDIDDEMLPVVKFDDSHFESTEVEGTEVEERRVNTIATLPNGKVCDIDFTSLISGDYDDVNETAQKISYNEEDYLDEAQIKNELKRKRMLDIDDDFVF